VDQLRWSGATPAFPAWAEKMGDARLLARVQDLEAKLAASTAIE